MFRRQPARRILLTVVMLLLSSATGLAAAVPQRLPAEDRQQFLDAIRAAVSDSTGWNRIRAAEALTELGYPEEAVAALRDQEATAPPEERIGVWRVLARAAPSAKERRDMLDHIRRVAVDPQAPDRLHAVESLAKLGYRITDEERSAIQEMATGTPAQSAFPWWLLAIRGESQARSELLRSLTDTDPVARLRAAFSLSQLSRTTRAEAAALKAAALTEPEDSPYRGWIAAAALRQAATRTDREELTRLLETYLRSDDPQIRIQAANGFADSGTPDDRAALLTLMQDSDPLVRAASARAQLRIDRRIPHRMGPGDWAVIAAYLVGVLLIGWYYSRGPRTTEEYLLGGRSMRSWTVGLSLFATMVSTISYLTWPGEVILHGPMVLCGLLSYPLISLVVGRFLIPFFMHLKVTTAYEILETRLGVSVRLLGSLFFLTLRLLWMSVIIYATTTKVIVPILGLDPSLTPWIGAILGGVTVAYTSQGGLRAVVAADVVQALILIGGAVVSMVVITINLGGVSAWWPTEWPAHWQEPVIAYDWNARFTVVGAMVATFTWFLCTAGSDQMAIQRYLATRDIKSARRMYNVSLASGAFVETFLCVLGFALLAYFRVHREMLGDGQSITSNADQLFPRFIVVGLPEGLTGLVIAGLIAAAMSSLSSGLNSSCSVVTIDLIDRFRRNRETETNHVRVAKFVSVVIGVIVVLLSLLVGAVQGNLLELAFKVVNLLVAPLFGLFFMAMFVPWATAFGTLGGAAVGVATVVSINFWKELTGLPGPSFIWAMPVSLAAQISAGSLLSLLPIGRPAVPLRRAS